MTECKRIIMLINMANDSATYSGDAALLINLGIYYFEQTKPRDRYVIATATHMLIIHTTYWADVIPEDLAG